MHVMRAVRCVQTQSSGHTYVFGIHITFPCNWESFSPLFVFHRSCEMDPIRENFDSTRVESSIDAICFFSRFLIPYRDRSPFIILFRNLWLQFNSVEGILWEVKFATDFQDQYPHYSWVFCSKDFPWSETQNVWKSLSRMHTKALGSYME